jgi:hypothetical protein
MVSKVDRTVECRDFKKKSQLLQLVDCRFFVDFAWDFSSDFSGKVEEFVQNGLKTFKIFPSKSTVDYVADPRSCNSQLFSRKLTILSTMVSKVDRTVDFQDFHPTTVDFSKKSPATVDL